MDGVKLLTIGEFARASRLSQKALRLYDDLGLLRPHAVDKWSGYRYYAPSQLERAQLIARLRRLGLPLAQIGTVLSLPPGEAAAQVAAFLRVTEAEFAERQELAQFLIGYLSEGTDAMSVSPVSLAIRCAAGSDRGLVRERNQDASYAGPLPDAAGALLFAVADGFGPDGERASAAVIDALRGFKFPAAAAGLLDALSDLVAGAVTTVRALAPGNKDELMPASTLTAMLWTGSQLALVHIGDTRAYLLRDGGLFQLTHDDSVAQSMVDAGQLTAEEAAAHPQRAWLLKAVGLAGDNASTPALSLHDVRAGDRYLLSSDGLTAVVPVPAIRGVLRDAALSPQEVVTRLITLANEAGGPDNVACAVADVTVLGPGRHRVSSPCQAPDVACVRRVLRGGRGSGGQRAGCGRGFFDNWSGREGR